MTHEELVKSAIVRALRRDVPNGGRGWGPWYEALADAIDRGEWEITQKKKQDEAA